MKVIKETGLNLNRDKCEFGKAVINFLGFRVMLGRIEPRQRKVEAIVNFQRPASKKQISQWCGLASYYQKFFHILRLLLPYSQARLRKTNRLFGGMKLKLDVRIDQRLEINNPLLLYRTHHKQYKIVSQHLALQE